LKKKEWGGKVGKGLGLENLFELVEREGQSDDLDDGSTHFILASRSGCVRKFLVMRWEGRVGGEAECFCSAVDMSLQRGVTCPE
jgi:hypothetical protein